MTRRRQPARSPARPSSEGRRRRPGWGVSVASVAVLTAFGFLFFLALRTKEPSPPTGQPGRVGSAATGGAPSFQAGTSNAPSPVEAAGRVADAARFPDLTSVQGLKHFELNLIGALLAEYPANPGVLGLAGSVHNTHGDHARAVAYWEEVIKLAPGEVRAYDAIAQIALLREEHERALGLWRQAATLDPNLPQVHYHLGQALMLMGDPEAAIAEFEKDIQAEPRSSQGYSLAGQLCRQLGRLEQARDTFQREIAVRPDSAKAYYGLSTVCAQLGDAEASKRYLEVFQTLKVQDARADQDARSAYDDLLHLRGRVAQTCTAAGEIHFAHGRMAEAETAWQQAGRIDTNDVVSRAALATLCQRKGQLKEALPYCEDLIRIEPDNALRHLNLGVLYARLRRFDSASLAFQRVCDLAPERPEGFRLLAQMTLELNPAAGEAVPLASRAVALESSAENYFVLGQACAAAADWAGARRALEQALALEPQNAKIRAMYEQLRSRN